MRAEDMILLALLAVLLSIWLGTAILNHIQQVQLKRLKRLDKQLLVRDAA
ncbi:hypothetical protein [Henriciella pelagia]